mgnify:CR=1 FL=1
MNKTNREAVALIGELAKVVKDAACDVVVCPVSICLSDVLKAAAGTNIKVGGQNMYHKDSGAYTGEVSPVMLKELGAEYVILGHSERRQYFKETDGDINLKTKAAMAHGLKPIVCVGETLEEREAGTTYKVIEEQLSGSLNELDPSKLELLVIAYEPVWAIGTGKTATSQDANEVIGFIRKKLAEILGAKAAEETRILYGGSVKGSNATELMNMPEIDGALVGGASLDAVEFGSIVNY